MGRAGCDAAVAQSARERGALGRGVSDRRAAQRKAGGWQEAERQEESLPIRLSPTPPTGRFNEEALASLSTEADLFKLTKRQREVLSLLAGGEFNKEIARALNIAEATTKIHMAALVRALGYATGRRLPTSLETAAFLRPHG